MRYLLAEYLKTSRLVAGLDHTDACMLSGVSQSTMTRIENSHGNITTENIFALLQTYEVDSALRKFLETGIHDNTLTLKIRSENESK